MRFLSLIERSASADFEFGHSGKGVEHRPFLCPLLSKRRARLLLRLRVVESRPLTPENLVESWRTHLLENRAFLAVREVFNDCHILNPLKP